jgi:hypothetical protein
LPADYLLHGFWTSPKLLRDVTAPSKLLRLWWQMRSRQIMDTVQTELETYHANPPPVAPPRAVLRQLKTCNSTYLHSVLSSLVITLHQTYPASPIFRFLLPKEWQMFFSRCSYCSSAWAKHSAHRTTAQLSVLQRFKTSNSTFLSPSVHREHGSYVLATIFSAA